MSPPSTRSASCSAEAAPVFRAAGASDINAIVALVQAAYRGAASRRGWTTEADLLGGQRIDAAGVHEAIVAPRSQVLLAHDGAARLIACAHIAERDGEGYFGMFAVRPQLQARGLGSAVLREAERRVQRLWGVTRMGMTVIDLRTELLAWYARRGWHRSGRHAPFPYGDVRFGLPRRDDLRFEWLYKDLRPAAAEAPA